MIIPQLLVVCLDLHSPLSMIKFAVRCVVGIWGLGSGSRTRVEVHDAYDGSYTMSC